MSDATAPAQDNAERATSVGLLPYFLSDGTGHAGEAADAPASNNPLPYIMTVDMAPREGDVPYAASKPSLLPHTLIAAVAALAAVVFLSMPDIDLWVGRHFYIGKGGFIGGELASVRFLRNVFIVFFWACVLLSIVGMVRTRKSAGAWLGWRFPHWLFMAVCLGVGPGLVANLMLKDQWGRPRPKHLIEFGGSKTFTPPILMSKQCPRNCSFVSGEAAAIYIPFYAAAAVMPQSAVLLVATGTAMGLAAGAVRIAQGGHFLSDVIFAGVFMGLTVLIVRRLMFGPPIAPRLRARIGALVARRPASSSA